MNKYLEYKKIKNNNFNFNNSSNIYKNFFNEYKTIIFILLISIFLLFSLGYSLDIMGQRLTTDFNIKKILVSKNSSISEISSILKTNKIINCKGAFKVFSILFNSCKDFKYGLHDFKPCMNYFEIIEELKKSPDVIKTRVTIPEGFEVARIIDRLCQKKLINKKVFMDELEKADFDYSFVKSISRKEKKLEGYLFPATYEIEENESEHSIINKFLKKFSDTVVPIYGKKNCEYSLDEIVTLASIIERESFPDDMNFVSSVFHNRLKQGLPLGSCATVMYILGIRKEILSIKDTKINSPYNTYIFKGLPVGPISCPGEKAIVAALNPTETKYLYFVKSKDGLKHIFTNTLEEHLKAARN